MIKGITLTSSMRTNLSSLKALANQMSKTQNVLSTGKRVNSAIDNASNYYQARALTNRAADLNALLDSMGQGIQTIEAATQGLDSALTVVEQATAIANQAYETAAIDVPSKTWLAQQENVCAVVSTWEELKCAIDSGIIGDIVIYGKIDCKDTLNIKSGQNLVGVDVFGISNTRNINFSALTFYDFNTQESALVLNDNTKVKNLFLDFTSSAALTCVKLSEDSSVAFENTDIQSNINKGNVFKSEGQTNLHFNSENNIGTFNQRYVFQNEGDITNDVIYLDNNDTLNITSNSPWEMSVFHSQKINLFNNSELNIICNKMAFYGGKGDFTDNSKINIMLTGNSYFSREFEANFYDSSQLRVKSFDGLSGWKGLGAYNINSKDVKIILDCSNKSFVNDEGAIYLPAVEGVSIQTSEGIFQTNSNVIKLEIPMGSSLPSPFVLVDTIPTNADDYLSDKIKEMYKERDKKTLIQELEEVKVDKYTEIMTEFDKLIVDSSYQGVNLLTGGELKVSFNENSTHELSVKGKDIRSEKIGIKTKKWNTKGDVEDSINELLSIVKTMRDFQAELGNSYSIIQTRQNFTSAVSDVLEPGADDLVLADMNEASAEYLMLQTRQQLATNSLSLAAQSAQSILKLF